MFPSGLEEMLPTGSLRLSSSRPPGTPQRYLEPQTIPRDKINKRKRRNNLGREGRKSKEEIIVLEDEEVVSQSPNVRKECLNSNALLSTSKLVLPSIGIGTRAGITENVFLLPDLMSISNQSSFSRGSSIAAGRVSSAKYGLMADGSDKGKYEKKKKTNSLEPINSISTVTAALLDNQTVEMLQSYSQYHNNVSLQNFQDNSADHKFMLPTLESQTIFKVPQIPSNTNASVNAIVNVNTNIDESVALTRAERRREEESESCDANDFTITNNLSSMLMISGMNKAYGPSLYDKFHELQQWQKLVHLSNRLQQIFPHLSQNDINNNVIHCRYFLNHVLFALSYCYPIAGNNDKHNENDSLQKCLVFVPKDIFNIYTKEQMQIIFNKIGLPMRWVCRVCHVVGQGFKNKPKYDFCGVGSYYFQKHTKFHRQFWKNILVNLRFADNFDHTIETQQAVRRNIYKLKDLLLEFGVFSFDYP
ncbi:hypothetical protein RFI_17449 [Reticulomyxa filosa]|uniref:Uncharacterized protein n=1 Tax=Reticulomyxa filosa TaxID=46433 RepID=X6N395_RETFI|nr:hypothetical protein RFI_17449 [Reticulomyxa filosa]|eukprot:ETO19782.1 hypothetical protein RFI_17449 [Reticulomyxa filosa]